MTERREYLALVYQAEHGDLRPQVNPTSVLRESPRDLRAVERVLIDRLFQLSRPIACTPTAADGDLRLSDSGRFFYLVEALRRAGGDNLDETLLVILDDFLQLTERSYDELYLWSIVELSRRDPRHVEVFWPAAIALDQRFRNQPWERPANVLLHEQPYRLCELLFYYFVVSTVQLKKKEPPLPSLGRCLRRIAPQLTPEQKQLVGDTLRQMERGDWRDVYGDAFGMLMHRP
jgi:hypothetical protein